MVSFLIPFPGSSLIFTLNSYISTLISFLCLIFFLLVSVISPSSPVYEPLHNSSVCLSCVACARCAIKKGGEIQGREGYKIVLCGCVRNYSGALFIAPILDLNRIPITAPFSKVAGYTRSTYHTWVKYRCRDFDLTFNPDTYVQNGFLHFRFVYWLTFSSTNRASFPIMPSIER